MLDGEGMERIRVVGAALAAGRTGRRRGGGGRDSRIPSVGRTVFITGAGRGIGRATAVAFAEAGDDLFLVDICAPIAECPYPMASPSDLEETAERCRRAGGRVGTSATDV